MPHRLKQETLYAKQINLLKYSNLHFEIYQKKSLQRQLAPKRQVLGKIHITAACKG